MTGTAAASPERWLAAATVHPSVLELRPDYRALLLAVEGIVPGPGDAASEAEPGEVVRVDDAGVTCRRWNWRQARRTTLTDATTAALLIIDALDPLTDQALAAAADDLAGHLTRLGPQVRVSRRQLAAHPMPAPDTARPHSPRSRT